jgi:hypothetical protein
VKKVDDRKLYKELYDVDIVAGVHKYIADLQKQLAKTGDPVKARRLWKAIKRAQMVLRKYKNFSKEVGSDGEQAD